jgi:hypothetical protein
VAHLVIEEHKGCKIPLRVKLEELFSMYLNASKEYTEKDVVQVVFIYTKRFKLTVKVCLLVVVLLV